MTPAIKALQKTGIAHQIHEYSHDATHTSFGLEAAEKLGVDNARVFKTLVVSLDNTAWAVGIVPVTALLNMKSMASAAGAKKAIMAEPTDVQRLTGYVLGGVSPIGQKKRLKTFIDQSALQHTAIFVSAGRRGLEIELSPNDLQTCVNAKFVALAQ